MGKFCLETHKKLCVVLNGLGTNKASQVVVLNEDM